MRVGQLVISAESLGLPVGGIARRLFSSLAAARMMGGLVFGDLYSAREREWR